MGCAAQAVITRRTNGNLGLCSRFLFLFLDDNNILVTKCTDTQSNLCSTKILDQLLEALLSKRSFRSYSPNSSDQAYGSMSVNLLRKKLNERELDYDGSREIMIQRLEKWDVENNQQESPQAAPIVASSQPVEVD